MCYSLTWSDRKVIESFKEHAKKECIYCGKRLTDKKEVTVDHLLTVSRNGKTIKDNLAICCSECNKDKSDMDYNEYIQYLSIKQYVLNNSKTWNEFNSAIKSFEGIVNTYTNAVKNIAKLMKEKKELEKIIRDINANASEGYLLFRDLQIILKELEENQKIQSTTHSASLLAKESIRKLREEKTRLENNLMNDVRNECGIGQITKLNIEKIDFSKLDNIMVNNIKMKEVI